MSAGAHGLALTGPVGDPASPVHRLDPRAKLLGFLAITCTAVSAPLADWPVYAGCALALTGLAAAARVPAHTVWRRARAVLAPVLLVALLVPFVDRGGEEVALGPLTLSAAGLAVLGTVAAKATIGTVGAVLLGATTSYPAVLRALEALRVPRACTLIAAVTYRYLFVLVEELSRMRAALAARGYRPRTALGVAATGRLAGSLFLRAHARGERVHLAMAARGYTGTMPQLEPLAFRRADATFLALLVVGLLALRVAA
ncbi:MAG TPA: cobalt ECF transporter T component CbiQ [Solirubrobacteraceae bacterium]|nr:cobalt ECF transporter T component CbiQ [Solirubrobacteraceae bacterium]